MENTVAYIVHTQKNDKFRLFMANPIEIQEDKDSILQVTLTGPRFDDLDKAQEALKKDHQAMLDQGITPCYNPIKSNPMMGGYSWLSELKAANPDEQL
jgi:hypothetical protein